MSDVDAGDQGLESLFAECGERTLETPKGLELAVDRSRCGVRVRRVQGDRLAKAPRDRGIRRQYSRGGDQRLDLSPECAACYRRLLVRDCNRGRHALLRRPDLLYSSGLAYASGVYAVVHLHVSGSVGASVGATASHTYGFQFGNASANVFTPAPAPDLSTDIELSEQLLAPGSTLNEPSTVTVRYLGLVESRSDTPGEVAQSASSDISGAVICIDLPPGVTWVSDSGAFGAPGCKEALPSLTGGAIAALAVLLVGSALLFAGPGRRELA